MELCEVFVLLILFSCFFHFVLVLLLLKIVRWNKCRRLEEVRWNYLKFMCFLFCFHVFFFFFILILLFYYCSKLDGISVSKRLKRMWMEHVQNDFKVNVMATCWILLEHCFTFWNFEFESYETRGNYFFFLINNMKKIGCN